MLFHFDQNPIRSNVNSNYDFYSNHSIKLTGYHMKRSRTFIEGELQFSFSEDWLVRKYDAHTFYQGLSGIGLKGVDFIAVRPNRMVLIEVKNYQRFRNGRIRQSVADALENPDKIGRRIAQKANDTFRAMEAIRAYYKRRLSYRLSYPFLRTFWWQWSDFSVWSHATDLAEHTRTVDFLVWMITDRHDQHIVPMLSEIIDTHLEIPVRSISVTNNMLDPIPGLYIDWAG